MKIGTGIMTVVASAGIAAAGIIGAPNASATETGSFGSWQKITDQNGNVQTQQRHDPQLPADGQAL
jgi:hypothetical protein